MEAAAAARHPVPRAAGRWRARRARRAGRRRCRGSPTRSRRCARPRPDSRPVTRARRTSMRDWRAGAWSATSTASSTAPDDDVRWYELSPRGFRLQRTPLDVSGAAARASRALARGLGVHLGDARGRRPLRPRRARASAWTIRRRCSHPSPFDWERQALCYLPPRLPEPNTRDYTAAVADALLPVLRRVGRPRVRAVRLASRAARGRRNPARRSVAAVRAGRGAAARAAAAFPRIRRRRAARRGQLPRRRRRRRRRAAAWW